MSVREMVVLGSASQVPTRFRNHNGYLLLVDGHGVLFDPGEGTQRQMTRFGVRAHQIHHVCITHFHGDHCLGLPGVIQRIHLDAVPHPVSVHFPASGRHWYDRLRYASAFKERATLHARPHTEAGPLDTVGPFTLSTRPLDHSLDAWGYRLEEPPRWSLDPQALAERGLRGPLVGRLKAEGAIPWQGGTLRLEDVATQRPGTVIAFVMDTRPCPGALDLARGADLLVCESTFLESEQSEAHQHRHMTAADAGRLAAEAGARRLLLTHFSQRYPLDAPFAAEARRFHDDVVTASDGLRVAVPRPERPR